MSRVLLHVESPSASCILQSYRMHRKSLEKGPNLDWSFHVRGILSLTPTKSWELPWNRLGEGTPVVFLVLERETERNAICHFRGVPLF